MKVKLQEVIVALQFIGGARCDDLANRLIKHGIEEETSSNVSEKSKTVPYTPMTNDEFDEIGNIYWNDPNYNKLPKFQHERNIEQAVLARARIAPSLDQKATPEISLADAKQICEQAWFAVVPKEPTQAIADAAYEVDKRLAAFKGADIYRAMLRPVALNNQRLNLFPYRKEAAKEVKP